MGSLSIVDINVSTISLTWTPPFTLNITQVEPDIAGYCVDVTTSSTTGSWCEIDTTGFNYSLPRDGACYNFTFVVTPVNVVGNGIPEAVSYSQVNESNE